MTIRNLGLAGLLLLIAQPGLANAGQQADPVDPHAGHMTMSEGIPAAEPHAHHHHASSGPPVSMLDLRDPKFSAALPASSPANGAVLEQSPRTISLTFPTAITVQQIALTTAVGQRVPIASPLPAGNVTSFTSPIVPLERGSYTLRWRGSNDAGELGGVLAFSIK